MSSDNYGKGRKKGFGDEVRVNEFWGLDPENLPQIGDFVLLKSRAHELIEVTQSKSKSDTIRYKAVIRRIEEIPKGARVFDSFANIRDY